MQEFLLLFGGGGGEGDMLSFMMPIILMVLVFYFMIMRPRKNQEKQAQEMRNSMEVGDEIVTVGGILGRVVKVSEDNILIESGSANTKLRITKAAVQTNITAAERVNERRQEAVQAAADAKEKKKAEKASKKTEKL